ncbi:MAG: hypothetical protein QMC40_06480 [Vicingaceae bacterium]
MKTKLFLSLLCCALSLTVCAQDDYDYDYDEEYEDTVKFSFGINFGAYFSSHETAEIYSGRPYITPFNIPFVFSQPFNEQVFRDYFRFAYQIEEYPLETRYRTASEIGGHIEYNLNEAVDLYLDVNITQLKFEQFFTVEIDDPNNGIIGPTFEQVPLFGEENRFHLNLGAQFSMYHDEYSNFYFSVFGSLNNTQMRRNYFVINNQEYEIFHVAEDRPNQRLGGIGYGGGAGLGFKYKIMDHLTTDFYYNMSYVQINLSENFQPFGFNHGLGIRIIWH